MGGVSAAQYPPILNQHLARISSDSECQYQPPQYTHTVVSNDTDLVSEWQVFQLLDTLPPTATGIGLGYVDKLPAWFLRVRIVLLKNGI